MERAYQLGTIEEEIFLMDLNDLPDDIVKTESQYGEQVIIISGWWVHIPEWGMNLRQGAICKSEGDKKGLPNQYVTVVQKPGEDGWLYYEESGFIATLYYWLKGEYTVQAIEGVPCYIRLPDLENEQSQI